MQSQNEFGGVRQMKSGYLSIFLLFLIFNFCCYSQTYRQTYDNNFSHWIKQATGFWQTGLAYAQEPNPILIAQSQSSTPDCAKWNSLLGGWDTKSFGFMRFKSISDGKVVGTYTEDGGDITGTLDGRTLKGKWVENRANKSCDEVRSEHDDRKYWGRYRIKFKSNSMRALYLKRYGVSVE